MINTTRTLRSETLHYGGWGVLRASGELIGPFADRVAAEDFAAYYDPEGDDEICEWASFAHVREGAL